MKRNGWHYVVEACIELTPEEFRLLMHYSGNHYDGVCQNASKVGGFLYGFKNQIGFGRSELTVTSYQLGIMGKILETAYLARDEFGMALCHELTKLHIEMTNEYKLQNKYPDG